MNMKKYGMLLWVVFCGLLSSCLSTGAASSAAGGEVTGVGGMSYSEPTPYGMVLVKKGSLKI